MEKEEFLSIPELARLLGISRIAVYKRVKGGKIQAVKIGKNFAIPKRYIAHLLGKDLNEDAKKEIKRAVKRTVREYGEVLKRLGRE